MTDTILFDDATTTVFDSVPPLADVEHPCAKCGKETGWSGRGRKKKYCDECKPARTNSGNVRVTGNSASQAAQAAKVLSGINSMMALGAGALKLFRTMGAMLDGNEAFEQAAYNALLTNPKLCRQILSVGEKSSGVALIGAYGAYGMGILPTLMDEVREKKEARIAEMSA